MRKQNTIANNKYFKNADIAYSLAIAVIWVLMVILVNPIGDFPLNDDWAFGQAVKSVVEKGEFQLSGWGAMNLFSQVWWGALFCLPFGFSFTALRFSTLVLGLIGVLATYGLLRETNLTAKIAFLGALLVAVNPLYFSLSNTFMTDVPFFAFSTLAFWFLVRGLNRSSKVEISLGMIWTCIALLIRQLGLAIFLAFSCAYVIKKGIKIQNIIKGFLPTVFGVCLQIFYQKWLQDSGKIPASYGKQVSGVFQAFFGNTGKIIADFCHNIFFALIYLGLLVFPLIFLLFLLKLTEFSRRKKLLILFGLSAISIASAGRLVSIKNLMPLSGNVLNKFGIGPLTLRDTSFGLNKLTTPTAMKIFWGVLTLIGIVGAVVLILYFIFAIWHWFLDSKHSQLDKNWLAIFMVSASFIYLLPLGVAGFFDRYLIWLIPLSMVFIAVSTKNIINEKISSTAISFALLMLLFSGIFTVGATHDYLSWNRVRWQALNNLMQESQISPSSIDGGFEFNGWYLYDPNFKRSPDKSWWWVDKDDYMISFGLLTGYEEIKRYSFSRWLPFGVENILVLRKINQ